ncbi:hypothetical protein J2Z33_000795 [Rubellimicrobium aerolatum]|nr:hypothetical protein [Rubellimicrobium aerolatum]
MAKLAWAKRVERNVRDSFSSSACGIGHLPLQRSADHADVRLSPSCHGRGVRTSGPDRGDSALVADGRGRSGALIEPVQPSPAAAVRGPDVVAARQPLVRPRRFPASGLRRPPRLSRPAAASSRTVSLRTRPDLVGDATRGAPHRSGHRSADAGAGNICPRTNAGREAGRLGHPTLSLAVGSARCRRPGREGGDRAMVAISVLGSRPFVGLMLLMLLLCGVLGTILVLLPVLLIEAEGSLRSSRGGDLSACSARAGRDLASHGWARREDRVAGAPVIGPLVVAAGLLLMLCVTVAGSWWTKMRVSLAVQGEPLSLSISTSWGARQPPKRASTASSIMFRTSEPPIPAFATARQAMASRSWASMRKAPRTTSPFRAR